MILPSILAATPTDLEATFNRLRAWAPAIHFDVADGLLVPNQTVSLTAVAHLPKTGSREIHLMTANPGALAQEAAAQGFDSIIVHYEALDDPRGELARFEEDNLGVTLACNPETDLEIVAQLPFKRLLLMTIHPGFQGQSLLPQSLDRLRLARRLLPQIEIEVDGGINLENFHDLYAAGARRFVVGSAILATANPHRAYAALTTLEQSCQQEFGGSERS